jgi:hypothetical protein
MSSSEDYVWCDQGSTAPNIPAGEEFVLSASCGSTANNSTLYTKVPISDVITNVFDAIDGTNVLQRMSMGSVSWLTASLRTLAVLNFVDGTASTWR